jgi:hypothetical protein
MSELALAVMRSNAKRELELNELKTLLEDCIFIECRNAQAGKTSPDDWRDNARMIARKAVNMTRAALSEVPR